MKTFRRRHRKVRKSKRVKSRRRRGQNKRRSSRRQRGGMIRLAEKKKLLCRQKCDFDINPPACKKKC